MGGDTRIHTQEWGEIGENMEKWEVPHSSSSPMAVLEQRGELARYHSARLNPRTGRSRGEETRDRRVKRSTDEAHPIQASTGCFPSAPSFPALQTPAVVPTSPPLLQPRTSIFLHSLTQFYSPSVLLLVRHNINTHPSSTVSSAAKSTRSRLSRTFRFSICPRRRRLTASWKAVSVA